MTPFFLLLCFPVAINVNKPSVMIRGRESSWELLIRLLRQIEGSFYLVIVIFQVLVMNASSGFLISLPAENSFCFLVEYFSKMSKFQRGRAADMQNCSIID